MQIAVTGKQISVGEALSGHAEERLAETVQKYFDQAVEASVVFSREGHGHQVRTDISVHVGRGIQVHGRGRSEDAYASFDQASERIAKQLRRYKSRLRTHHRRESAEATTIQAQKYVLAAENADAEETGEVADQPVIVAEMTTAIESLTVSEAVMRMDLADTSALVFQNKAHGGLNVVYRRGDGNIGWIDPQGNATGAAAKPVA